MQRFSPDGLFVLVTDIDGYKVFGWIDLDRQENTSLEKEEVFLPTE